MSSSTVEAILDCAGIYPFRSSAPSSQDVAVGIPAPTALAHASSDTLLPTSRYLRVCDPDSRGTVICVRARPRIEFPQCGKAVQNVPEAARKEASFRNWQEHSDLGVLYNFFFSFLFFFFFFFFFF